MNRSMITGAAVLAALFALLQLVPYGRQHTKPAGGTLVSWDSPRTLELARRACFDCHSNETRWPWYASVAPVSWRIQRHVEEGRRTLDFTAFEPSREKVAEAAGEAAESVTKGEMPPQDYMLAHPTARLNPTEKQELLRGLETTFAEFAERGDAH